MGGINTYSLYPCPRNKLSSQTHVVHSSCLHGLYPPSVKVYEHLSAVQIISSVTQAET